MRSSSFHANNSAVQLYSLKHEDTSEEPAKMRQGMATTGGGRGCMVGGALDVDDDSFRCSTTDGRPEHDISALGA